jgi:hypothetical protein
MKRSTLLLLLCVLVIGVAGSYFAYAMLGSDALTQFKPSARFIEPDGYYTSSLTRGWYTNPETAKGKVLFPEIKDVGDQRRAERPFERHDGFLGPESCRECHAEIYDSFIETAHFKTSRLPKPEEFIADFSSENNELITSHAGMSYEMEQRGDEVFQKVLLEKDGKTYQHEERIDIVTGSGNHALTYLYWKDNRLYQLPVTWSTDQGVGWINSPGYQDGFADLARPILAQCIACHATRFEVRVGTANEFDRDSIILGVTCERCHGPGKDHVDFHRENPEENMAKYIVHPGDLPRERMNEVCGQCHNGKSKTIKPSFTFRPGDRLEEFNQFSKTDEGGLGVHTSNQNVRLIKSRCFIEDKTMDCRSCHNPHQNEHANLGLFSSRCMKCHQPQACGQFEHSGERIADNCIDCHMPKEDDKQMGMATESKQVFPEIRDHFIRVHPESTEAVLKKWAHQNDASKSNR